MTASNSYNNRILINDLSIKNKYMKVNVHSSQKRQYQLPLKRVNLGKDCKIKPKKQANVSKESQLATRKLRYYLHHRKRGQNNQNAQFTMISNDQFNSSLRFYDTQYFRHGKGVHYEEGGKLLVNDFTNYSKFFLEKDNASKPNTDKPNTNRLKSEDKYSQSSKKDLFSSFEGDSDSKRQSRYINFEIQMRHPSPLSTIRQNRPLSKGSFRERKKYSFSNDYRENSLRNETHQHPQNKINPYTKEKYLYIKKKDKDKVKMVADKLKNKQLTYNMLKPCQIYQKELNKRQYYLEKDKESVFTPLKNIQQEGSASNRTSKKNIVITHKRMQDFNTIEPWQTEKPINFEESI